MNSSLRHRRTQSTTRSCERLNQIQMQIIQTQTT
ncbi:hypothetical protein LINPERPRIM_LOCUS30106 [Linum perenne]